jgi:hypothetical protein
MLTARAMLFPTPVTQFFRLKKITTNPKITTFTENGAALRFGLLKTIVRNSVQESKEGEGIYRGTRDLRIAN